MEYYNWLQLVQVLRPSLRMVPPTAIMIMMPSTIHSLEKPVSMNISIVVHGWCFISVQQIILIFGGS